MKIKSVMHEGKARLRQRREKKREQIRSELERYGSEILHSDEMREAFRQTHHTRSTVGEHTQRVAEKSLAICHALEKLHIRTDIPAVVEASLCHDLGILDRDAKFESEEQCLQQHPADSVAVARKLVEDLPDKTAEIIERHMWPGAGSKAPDSLEGIIVAAADKAAAVEDFVRGSKTMPTDWKTALGTIIKRNRGLLWKTKKR